MKLNEWSAEELAHDIAYLIQTMIEENNPDKHYLDNESVRCAINDLAIYLQDHLGERS